jgi:hypothetical protein
MRTLSTRRTAPPYPALVALAILAAMSAACSTPGATAAGSAPNDANAGRTQALRFAGCMRDHGIGAFPDPDSSGTLTIETVANGTSIDTNSPAFEQAITACKNLEPGGFTGFTRTPAQQQAALRFAQCIRDNGVQDFPDPALDAPLIDTDLIPSANTPGGMTILHAAMQKCTDLAGAAGVDR